jgi:hypothetical protein
MKTKLILAALGALLVADSADAQRIVARRNSTVIIGGTAAVVARPAVRTPAVRVAPVVKPVAFAGSYSRYAAPVRFAAPAKFYAPAPVVVPAVAYVAPAPVIVPAVAQPVCDHNYTAPAVAPAPVIVNVYK